MRGALRLWYGETQLYSYCEKIFGFPRDLMGTGEYCGKSFARQKMSGRVAILIKEKGRAFYPFMRHENPLMAKRLSVYGDWMTAAGTDNLLGG